MDPAILPWDHFVHFSPHSLGDIMADVLAKFCTHVFVHDPRAIVAKVMATRPLNLYFRRALVDIKLVQWQNLIAQIANVQLMDGSDTFR